MIMQICDLEPDIEPKKVLEPESEPEWSLEPEPALEYWNRTETGTRTGFNS